MTIQTVSRGQALERLKAEQVRHIEKNQTHAAERMEQAQSVLERGEGETLWDIYRNAGDKADGYSRRLKIITPDVNGNPGRVYKKYWGILAAGAVGTVAAGFLRTGNVTASLAWGLLPLGAGLLPLALVADDVDIYKRDIGVPIATVVATTPIALQATWNWLPTVGTAVGLTAAFAAPALYLAGKKNKQLEIQQVIDQNKDLLLKPPAASDLAELGRRLSKEDILGTLERLKGEALAGGDYQQAMELRRTGADLRRSRANNFYDMMLEGDTAQRRALSRYTEPILEDARRRAEVQDLVDGLDGSRAAADLLVGLDSVIAGEHEIPIGA